MDTTTCGIIVAAGAGKRLGADIPKAFVPLAGRPMVAYSVDVFNSHPAITSIVLVVHSGMEAEAKVLGEGLQTPLTVVPGGEHRWQSVQNGVAAADAAAWVLVHDAARPFLTAALIDALLEKRSRFKCAIAATPMVDTVRRFEDDRCVETLDRETLLRVGTPQLFHTDTLRGAFERAHTIAPPPTDEAILMEACGYEVGVAWGDPLNFKITTPQDLFVAESVLRQKGDDLSQGTRRTQGI